MSRRPSFQFYPSDFAADPRIQAMSHADVGVWWKLVCMLHESEEYGIIRWPLTKFASALHTRIAVLLRLEFCTILRGSDGYFATPLLFIPSHARQQGAPVTLIPAQQGPIWFSARMVRDEYVRQIRGKQTRFDSPKGSFGEWQGDGSASPPPPPPASINNATPLGMDTEACARGPQLRELRGFGNTGNQTPNPNWQVPSLDDPEGLDRFARSRGVRPETFASYKELQRHLIGLQKAENEAKRNARR